MLPAAAADMCKSLGVKLKLKKIVSSPIGSNGKKRCEFLLSLILAWGWMADKEHLERFKLRHALPVAAFERITFMKKVLGIQLLKGLKIGWILKAINPLKFMTVLPADVGFL